MPEISKAFGDLLGSKAAITTLVASRITSDIIPELADPDEARIVYWVVSEVAHEDLNESFGLDQARIQCDAYARTRSDASALASTIWQQITGTAEVVSQVWIMGVSRVRGINHSTDRPEAGKGRRRFRASQDFLLTYDSIDLVV